MDIVHARADLVGVVEFVEYIQQLHVGTGGLNGDHVRIHVRDRLNDVVELRIAHVGMDLSAVRHTVGTDAERLHRPVQILGPLAAAQWQAFTQRSFIDLNDIDTGTLQVLHFLTDRKCQLVTAE